MASLMEQGSKLSGTGETGRGAFGDSVALSADGSTALVGAPQDKHGTGAAWVFVRSGDTWAQQGGKITASGEVGHGNFGISVALSGDGNTALTGSPRDGKGEGATYVFTRSGETWTQRARFTGGEQIGHSSFGRRVAISSDGQTALIGGFGDNDDAGAAWVFVRSGESWTQQGGKLTGPSETGAGQFGGDVALSGDGTTALIGGPADNGAVGAVWFFARSGGAWAPQGSKVTASDETGAAEFGRSVSLTDEGNTALIGGPVDSGDLGAAWVFTFNGEAWSQSSKLTAGTTKGHPDFGRDIALSGNGETALIGAPKAHVGAGGAAWVFTLQGGEWTPQSEPLTGGAETKHGDFARSVALSDDGGTALVGGPKDNRFGAAWTYAE
jgi:FG-GAP repeat